ncbi:MAG: hypothetical protein WBG62_06510, partial [Cyclobacteriaceae bacterium]
MRTLYLACLMVGILTIPAFAQNEIPDSVEYAALKALYDSTDGAGWDDDTNWLSGTTSADFATWYGVTVSNGDVSEINLQSNNLNGTIPPAINDLKKLVRLRLHQNDLAGSLPQLYGLTDLYSLDLSNNWLSGAIPVAWGGLSALEYLQVRNNELGGELPDSLRHLSLLIDLRLSGNNLIGEVPQWLDSLPDLEYLYLDHNYFNGPFPQNWSLQYINFLNLSYNNFDAGPIPDWVVSDSDLAYLNLRSCHFTGQIPESQDTLGNLRSLYISHNNLSGALPDWISHCGLLKTLEITNNHLTGSIPSSYSSLQALTTLNLIGNELAGPIPGFLKDLPLRYLYLSDNMFSGIIPENLGQMTTLEYLKLDDNELEGPIPSSIGNGGNLRAVYLGENNLSGTIPASFNQATGLLTLSLSFNNLSAVSDLTSHTNAANLRIYAGNNRLPWDEIVKLLEPDGSHVFSVYEFSSQTPDQAPPQIEYYQNQDTLRLVAGPDDPSVSYQWQVDSTGTWVDLPGETSYELIILNPPSTLLRYRALITTAQLAGTNTSRTYEVRSGVGAPNESPLEQYFPVDLQTGTLNMSIPIGTVSGRALSHSLSLVFNGEGGNRNSRSGLYGMNWSLAGGGSIQREMRGIPDDLQEAGSNGRVGWLYDSLAHDAAELSDGDTDSEKLAFFEDQGFIKDTEPDIFYLSFPGYSGKMVFDKEGEPRLQPLANLQVDVQRNATSQHIDAFTITDDSGITYRFDLKTQTYEYMDSLEINYFISIPSPNDPRKNTSDPESDYFTRQYKAWSTPLLNRPWQYTSGWYLTKISHPTGDEITLSWGLKGFKDQHNTAIGHHVNQSVRGEGFYAYQPQYLLTTNSQYAYLKEVKADREQILLQYNEVGTSEVDELYYDKVEKKYYYIEPEDIPVQDLSTSFYPNPAFRLSHAGHYYTGEDKHFERSSMFFGYRDGLIADWEEDKRNPRLAFSDKLLKITLRSGNIEMGEYGFNYYDGFEVEGNDLWGYGYYEPRPEVYVYRDENDRFELTHFKKDSTIIPVYTYDGQQIVRHRVGDGALSKVTFPSGGTATFTYDAHTFTRADRDDEYTTGAARIRAMRFHDGISKAHDVLKYVEYDDGIGQTTGRMMWEPRYAYLSPAGLGRHAGNYPSYLSEEKINEWIGNDDLTRLLEASIEFFPMNVNTADQMGPVARYERVTVSKPGEGEIVHEYDIRVYVGTYDHPQYKRTRNGHINTSVADSTYLYGADDYRRFPFAPVDDFIQYAGLMKAKKLF